MATLSNFPMLNQLDRSDTTDGRLAENFLYDCVPTCVAAMMGFATGQHFSPDALKDAAYGEGWANMGTAATAFVSYAAAHGVKLYSESGDPIALAHQLIQAGQPALFTRDDPYSTNPLDSHVSVWYGEAPGQLTALDPWNAQSLTKSDDEWRNHLWNNEVWTVEVHKDMPVPSGWKDNGQEFVAKNGVPVTQGFYKLIKDAPSWDGDNVPQEPEYHADPVQLHGDFGAGQRQVFRDNVLWWTPEKGVVNEHYIGLELHAAYQLLDAQAAKIKQLQAQPAPAPVSPDVKAIAQKAVDDLQPLLK